MRVRNIVLGSCLAATSIGAAVGVAQVNGRRHPNLAAAQRLTDQAYQRIVQAQQANEFDMNGHAAKAKELLQQANAELSQAAGAANRN
jgi:hypothetical protein